MLDESARDANRFVEVVDELPRNATGKVLKDELRALAADDPGSSA